MKDILFLLVMGLAVYVAGRLFLKEPILPWASKKDKNEGPIVPTDKKKKNKKKGRHPVSPLDEVEAAPFRELFGHVVEIEHHMIRHKDNTFTLMAEVEPVNYFLLDQEEQDGIDATFETWLSQLNYSVRIYLQNRFVDLTLPIQEIQQVMDKEDDLHPLARQFGQNMISDLLYWQNAQPRYETKRYLIFDYRVETKDIKADDAEDMEEKIVDKAFNELYRRLKTAQGQLRKADMNVQMLTTTGVNEVLYYGFNRRKAKKNHFRDIAAQEQLSLYSTADQTAAYVSRVKGDIENVQKEAQEEGRYYREANEDEETFAS